MTQQDSDQSAWPVWVSQEETTSQENFGTFPAINPLNEESGIEEQTIEEWQRWRRAAITVSMISVIAIFVLALAAFASSGVSKSSAEFAIAFDAMLGSVSSGVIMWRFYKGDNGNLAPEKERKACIVIASGFIISAIMMFTRAVFCLVNNLEPTKTLSLIIISSLACLGYTLLFCVKIKVAQKLQSVAMRTDSMDSAFGAIVAFGVIVSTVIYERARDTWWLDPAIAMAIAIATFTYGLLIIVKVTWKKEKFGEPKEYARF